MPLNFGMNNYVIFFHLGRCQGKISVSIVACDKLDEAKSKMDSVLSCHVYSVQKANLIDPTPLYNADYDLTKSLMFKCARYVFGFFVVFCVLSLCFLHITNGPFYVLNILLHSGIYA